MQVWVCFFKWLFEYLQESPSMILTEIDRRLEEDGLGSDIATEEKLFYIYRLYQTAEVNLDAIFYFISYINRKVFVVL